MAHKQPNAAVQLKTLERQSVLFEWYVNYAWNWHRKLVKGKLAPRCMRCAASTNFSPLDASGICAICREEAAKGQETRNAELQAKATREMEALLEQSQGKGTNGHDAIILFSGGKDSIFLIRELKRRYPKLRLLAFLYDSGLMGPRTLMNAERATSMLAVDFLHFKPDVSVTRRLFREAALFERPGYGCMQSGDMLEVYSMFHHAECHAQVNGIPLVIDGLNWSQVTVLYGDTAITTSDTTFRYAWQSIEPMLSAEMKTYLQASPGGGAKPHYVHPYYGWRYTENEIRAQVIEAGYVEKGSDSPVLTNNRFVSAMFFIDYHRLGYGSYENDICAQVRRGTAERIYWRNIFEMAEYSAKTGWLIKPVIQGFQKDLGLEGNPFKLGWFKA